MTRNKLYGAIYGDIVGRKYEYGYEGEIPADIDMFPENATISDDSIMTLASAYAILNDCTVETAYRYFGEKYLGTDNPFGFGKGFVEWIKCSEGYRTNSWGNGAIMRVSPFLWLDAYEEAINSATCSHNSVDALLAIHKLNVLYKEKLLNKHLIFLTKPEPVRGGFFVNAFDTYQIVEKLSHMNFESMEDALRYTIRLGGDTDTNASIFGELLNFRNSDWVTPQIKEYVESHLDEFLLTILKDFNEYD